MRTLIGWQKRTLRIGAYKQQPNPVYTANGTVHGYAPVHLVAQEMHRLCQALQSERFAAGHPLVQAAYAHFALVAVHPFQDGNGRTARVLGSLYTYHTLGLPMMVWAADKPGYFAAIRAADHHNPQPLHDFLLAQLEQTLHATANAARYTSAIAR